MDSKRLIVFIVLSLAILLGWQEFFAPPPPAKPAAVATATRAAGDGTPAAPQPAESSRLDKGQRIVVNTDVLRAEIDTMGGDLRALDLTQHGQTTDASKDFELLTDKGGRVYVAQTGLLSAADPQLPTHKTLFTAEKTDYTLAGDKVEVKLTAPEVNGVKVSKVYTFSKGSYLIDVRYDVSNASGKPLPLSAYYRLLRDNQSPEGESYFAHTFTGPALYTSEGKFQKVSFEDLDKNKASYVKNSPDGWVAMVQHYFFSGWITKPLEGKAICAKAEDCTYDIKKLPNGLYSAGVLVNLPTLANGASESISVPLYAGPEEYATITKLADGMNYVKDYGWVYIFASPLFWLLTKLHTLVGNWGWAIVLLTILVKAVFYPLTAASYRSMAKMKALAPRLETMKAQYGDDRMKFQQAVMEMYKQEKINPLGGCLPILIQIPVFIGLYWALLASVELRQAPWILWIHDLAKPDPYYVLPAIMAITMFIQTFLNPPPTDPVQAKMMKIMPVAFSVMFFFFPAGLVLYWVVNNVLSMAQQYYINRQIENARKAALQS